MGQRVAERHDDGAVWEEVREEVETRHIAVVLTDIPPVLHRVGSPQRNDFPHMVAQERPGPGQRPSKERQRPRVARRQGVGWAQRRRFGQGGRGRVHVGSLGAMPTVYVSEAHAAATAAAAGGEGADGRRAQAWAGS